MRGLIEGLERKTEGVGVSDDKVIEAFLNKKEASGEKLSTDGERLDGEWMGGRGIAQWKHRKIVFSDLSSKDAISIQKKIRSLVPERWISESEFEVDEAKVGNRKPVDIPAEISKSVKEIEKETGTSCYGVRKVFGGFEVGFEKKGQSSGGVAKLDSKALKALVGAGVKWVEVYEFGDLRVGL